VTLTPEIVKTLSAPSRAAGSGPAREIRFVSYPVMPTSVADGDLKQRAPRLSTPIDVGAQKSIVCLVLENVGKTEARDVEVLLEKLALSQSVKVEPTGPRAAYDTVVRNGAQSIVIQPLKLPRALETGSGVIIPLFVDVSASGGRGTWYFGSADVLLPSVVIYRDPRDGSQKQVSIRRMRDAIVLARLVEARG
jgi:hypothetical protein